MKKIFDKALFMGVFIGSCLFGLSHNAYAMERSVEENSAVYDCMARPLSNHPGDGGQEWTPIRECFLNIYGNNSSQILQNCTYELKYIPRVGINRQLHSVPQGRVIDTYSNLLCVLRKNSNGDLEDIIPFGMLRTNNFRYDKSIIDSSDANYEYFDADYNVVLHFIKNFNTDGNVDYESAVVFHDTVKNRVASEVNFSFMEAVDEVFSGDYVN